MAPCPLPPCTSTLPAHINRGHLRVLRVRDLKTDSLDTACTEDHVPTPDQATAGKRLQGPYAPDDQP